MVRTLLHRLDHHHAGERSHAERVAVYAVAVGAELGMSADALRTLRYAAQLHDVGKVRVDPQLLHKLGELSESDWTAMRAHAELSLEVIAEFDFLKASLPAITDHHERFDGLGYPSGKSGENIPVGARIIGLCEAFDAMTDGSGWQASRTYIEAREEIKRLAGKQFDPIIADAFLKIQPVIQPLGV